MTVLQRGKVHSEKYSLQILKTSDLFLFVLKKKMLSSQFGELMGFFCFFFKFLCSILINFMYTLFFLYLKKNWVSWFPSFSLIMQEKFLLTSSIWHAIFHDLCLQFVHGFIIFFVCSKLIDYDYSQAIHVLLMIKKTLYSYSMISEQISFCTFIVFT